jgi:hypothetical protein
VRLRRRARRLGAQQRDLERRALWRRQPGQPAGVDAVAQVDQRGERQLGLGAAGLCRQHAQPALAGRRDAGLPQRRLADSRRAGEDERALAVVEELVQHRDLALAPHHARHGVAGPRHGRTFSNPSSERIGFPRQPVQFRHGRAPAPRGRAYGRAKRQRGQP